MLATIVDHAVVVVDGECLPVPGLEVGARYHYPSAPSTWDSAKTDGDGVAQFGGEHQEMPGDVAMFVDGELCGTFPFANHARLTLEM